MSGLFDQITNYSPPLLTAGQVNYKGTWDAAANSPTLTSPPASTSKGDYYVVSTAGTQFSISFAVGDWIISNGTAWEKVDLTDAVSSVFGRTGAVVGVSTDYSAVGITNTAIGASSPSTGAFTTITATSTITATGAVTGSNLSGTNTGNQTISITGDVTAAGSTGVLTASVTKINGTSLAGLTTGILKNTTTTGVPSIAVAADFPTLNQSTTGSAATLTTPRAIYGNNFDGSAALTQVIAGTYGGTGVNNGANTITIAGNVTHAGAFTQSFTATANTALTLPTTGTLATLAGSEALSNKTITASAFNGTVGATTANTGQFTTLFANGLIKYNGSSAGELQFNSTSATTQSHTISSYYNTGAAFAPLNISAGTITSFVNGSNVSVLSSTGLAVTGALSATGNLTLSAANPSLIGGTNAGSVSIQNPDAGAYITIYGSAHATKANKVEIIGTGGVTLTNGLAVTGALSLTGAITISGSPFGQGAGVRYISGAATSTDLYSNAATGGVHYWAIGESIKATLTGTGLGIGTSSPFEKLTITGNIAFNNDQTERFIKGSANGGAIRLRSNSAAATDRGTQIGYTDNSGVWQAAYLSVVDGGNVGIGTTSPSTRLHVNGDSTFNQSSGYVFSITGGSLSGSQQFRHWVGSGTNYYIINDANAGVYLTYGGSSWTSNSDERAKDIIESIVDATSKVSSLRAVIGKYKTDSEGTRRSFLIAQDVQAVLPEAVDASNPENLGVQYTEVIPLLVASIKELTQRVAALESN